LTGVFHTVRKTISWWAYLITSVILLFFLAPAMISAADTFLVILGFAFLTAHGIWSWKFWILPLINKIREYNEL